MKTRLSVQPFLSTHAVSVVPPGTPVPAMSVSPFGSRSASFGPTTDSGPGDALPLPKVQRILPARSISMTRLLYWSAMRMCVSPGCAPVSVWPASACATDPESGAPPSLENVMTPLLQPESATSAPAAAASRRGAAPLSFECDMIETPSSRCFEARQRLMRACAASSPHVARARPATGRGRADARVSAGATWRSRRHTHAALRARRPRYMRAQRRREASRARAASCASSSVTTLRPCTTNLPAAIVSRTHADDQPKST